MKSLRSLYGVFCMMAYSSMSVTADANERPGEVAALKELKPHLLLLQGAEPDLDGADASFPVNPEEVAKLRALLSKQGTFLPWTRKNSRAAFQAEHTISWGDEGHLVEVSLSLASNEALVEVSGQAKKLRYEIGEDAKWELVKVFTDRRNAAQAKIEAHKERARAKADPVEKTDSWRRSIVEGANLAVHEGLPHPAEDSYKREMQRTDVRVSVGHAFYTPGVVARNRLELAKLIADAGSYHRWSGAKECGGFHPDFAVSWLSNRQTVMLLVCYGCHEVIFTDGKTSWRFDLDHKAAARMEPLLKANGGKRPVANPVSDPEPYPAG